MPHICTISAYDECPGARSNAKCLSRWVHKSSGETYLLWKSRPVTILSQKCTAQNIWPYPPLHTDNLKERNIDEVHVDSGEKGKPVEKLSDQPRNELVGLF